MGVYLIIILWMRRGKLAIHQSMCLTCVLARLEQCEDSPCLNGALCLVEDDIFRCYCVPDYHGKRCQFKYNECQLPPGEACMVGVVLGTEHDSQALRRCMSLLHFHLAESAGGMQFCMPLSHFLHRLWWCGNMGPRQPNQTFSF